jgi:hypothetical protein
MAHGLLLEMMSVMIAPLSELGVLMKANDFPEDIIKYAASPCCKPLIN